MFSLQDERRRKINLGGTSATATQASILEGVHAARFARAQHKRRNDNAIRIQAWYRGLREAKRTRKELKELFMKDVLSLTAMRCLVLIGKDDEVLSIWTSTMLAGDEDAVFSLAKADHRGSWIVLIRPLSLLLLQSVADKPKSSNSILYLRLLNILLSTEAATSALGDDAPHLVRMITDYLFHRQLYHILGRSVQLIPVKLKQSLSLPLILRLAVRPLSTHQPTTPEYSQLLFEIFVHILTIPLLPNRLPLDFLPQFVSNLALPNLGVLRPYISNIVTEATTDQLVNLAANLHMFVSPHYKLLPSAAFHTYLQLSVALLNSFPSAIFDTTQNGETSKDATRRPSTFSRDDSESDEANLPIRVSVVPSFVALRPPLPMTKVDDKTLKRLNTIISAQHVFNVIHIAQSEPAHFPQLVAYLFALTVAWSPARADILDVLLASTGGGLVRRVYRELVRTSPLGKAESSAALKDAANVPYFPPLLFLVDLYRQALLTMGDDEFFGNTAMGISGRSQRNPLTMDELIDFSKQLLNITFALYWRDDSVTSFGDTYISKDVRCTWEGLKERVTKCLLDIHARDSRKPFVPPDHWLVTSELDLSSFIEAAVLEEQSLSSATSDRPNIPISQRLGKRQLAAISPRLGILNNIPFSIPFAARVSIFRHFVVNDMMARGSLSDDGSWGGRFDPFLRGRGGRKTRVQIRRDMVAQDGFDRLEEVDLKTPIEITFIDQFGQEEAGIDGGGVFKEFFTSLCKEVFDTDRGLWLVNKKNELYPNPHAYATEPHSLNWYRFIGRVLGKAMYEGILVDVAFAGFFLSKWLGRQSFLDDLASLDPELYNGLIFLKHYEGNPEDLALNFAVASQDFGVTRTIDLIPNGSNVPVTKENRLQYIQLISHYRLSKQIRKQSDAFFEGLSEMIDHKWLRMFNQQEVQILIGGVNTPIDIADLQQHTNYGGLYDASHPTIRFFWQVVESFDQEQKKGLLRFVTSCSRPPLLGFRELVPNFSIRDATDDQYRLPTSSTCVNLLKLPRYTSESNLRKKLLQAINAGAGFDLS